METIIKNIHLLKNRLSESQLNDLEHGALLHRRHARITFKIVRFTDDVLTVETRQEKSPAGNYLDGKTLYQRTKELFQSNNLPGGVKIHVNTIPYVPAPAQDVSPEFIRHYMTELKIKVRDIENETGLDSTNISAWINGTREMSNIVRAMFYYYIKHKEHLKLQYQSFKPLNLDLTLDVRMEMINLAKSQVEKFKPSDSVTMVEIPVENPKNPGPIYIATFKPSDDQQSWVLVDLN
ncbi:hypothetical protein [Dyadobacter fermentans]|uniref:Uncharacterized protein n=1 Tax=Dyadobacter fermentans (strain ATCC 700827 / DSM 18053 / CIP 107007 / KCTC 52180 / NS114) TaxID=471854 RepID=C6VVI8_DYAFD|nr:hypothetical protein [Dyadobacter fermentans]ACT96718.1 hypothetical protein Dfer_5527 [Dyadobacter fermentans DSM 18053]